MLCVFVLMFEYGVSDRDIHQDLNTSHSIMKQYCESLIQILLIVQLLHPFPYFILEVDYTRQGSTREAELAGEKRFMQESANMIERAGQISMKSVSQEVGKGKQVGTLGQKAGGLSTD